MKICTDCPMRDERYESSDQQDKRTISSLKLAIAQMQDFIEFMFDHSEHLGHTTYNDVWQEFETWEESQTTPPHDPHHHDSRL